MTAPGLTRRQFAAEIGRSVGYVQKLVDTGRCVLTADGKIDGPASRARIAETQGGRPDVAERFAAQRQPAAAPAPSAPDIDVGHTDGSSRAKAKALLMHYSSALPTRLVSIVATVSRRPTSAIASGRSRSGNIFADATTTDSNTGYG